MKYLVTLFLLAISATLFAQPNITDSIHILQKICKHERNFVYNLFITKKGSIYGTTHKLDANNLKHFTLVKLNTDFDSLWTGVTYGGNQGAYYDIINRIAELPNGNLVLAGYCESKDSTLQGVAHSNYGREAWVMVVDSFGNILHQKCFGGGGGTQLYALYVDKYGDIYIGGNTNTNDYDFAHTFGSPNDAWLIKLDSSLNKIWTKIWGGNSDDIVTNINKGRESTELIISLNTESSDALLGSNGVIGMSDGCIIAIDTSGTEKWSKRYGGSMMDGIRKVMVDSLNKCYYFAGSTASIDGDVQYKTDSTFYLGEYKSNDWISKIDSVGNLLCSKAYGCKIVDTTNSIWGTQEPIFVDATFHNGAVWYTSYIEGGNGDFPPNTEFNRNDFWIAKIDSQCNLRGKYIVNTEYKTDGTNNFFYKNNELWTYGYSGNSSSPDDTSHSNPFSCDTTKSIRFYMQLGDYPLSVNNTIYNNNLNWQVFPNPTQEICTIQLEKENTTPITLIVSNSLGQIVFSTKIQKKQNYKINTQQYTKGIYYITLKTSTEQSTKQLVIQ